MDGRTERLLQHQPEAKTLEVDVALWAAPAEDPLSAVLPALVKDRDVIDVDMLPDVMEWEVVVKQEKPEQEAGMPGVAAQGHAVRCGGGRFGWARCKPHYSQGTPGSTQRPPPPCRWRRWSSTGACGQGQARHSRVTRHASQAPPACTPRPPAPRAPHTQARRHLPPVCATAGYGGGQQSGRPWDRTTAIRLPRCVSTRTCADRGPGRPAQALTQTKPNPPCRRPPCKASPPAVTSGAVPPANSRCGFTQQVRFPPFRPPIAKASVAVPLAAAVQ